MPFKTRVTEVRVSLSATGAVSTPAPSGSTKTMAWRKSGLSRTSETVTETSWSTGAAAS